MDGKGKKSSLSLTPGTRRDGPTCPSSLTDPPDVSVRPLCPRVRPPLLQEMKNTKRQKTTAEMLSRALVELADNNAHLLTILDLQARILAQLEAREQDDVVDEISELLKARRRACLREIDAWAQGASRLFEEEDGTA